MPACPTGIGRAFATYTIPLEGCDEWVTAAKRLPPTDSLVARETRLPTIRIRRRSRLGEGGPSKDLWPKVGAWLSAHD